MNLQTMVKIAHIVFYFHVAVMVAVAFLLTEWLVPVCITFAATAAVLYRFRHMYRQTMDEEANWLGA